jgi:glycosyltransferase involved in cell wall biosynthesis
MAERTPSPGLNVVLSFGDLSHSSGYRTRVLEELRHLDTQSGLDTHLLLFDRRPGDFKMPAGLGIPFRAQKRSALWRLYPEISRLSRLAPVRLVHAHNLYSAAMALLMRWLFGYRVILDYHGRIPEEYVYLGKGGALSQRLLEGLERWVVRHSDHVLAVSDGLADYLQSSHGIDRSKVTVIPCCTDSAQFKWDSRLRGGTRERLGLAEKLICTHLGSFVEWYDPELLVHSFEKLLKQFPDKAHLLVITPEVIQAREYFVSRLPEQSFTVLTADHSEVPALLNASDLGFLLLRPSPNIRTASPVKFAEYLSCGLPVVITPEVGDYSKLIQSSKAGCVVGQGRDLEPQFAAEILSRRREIAMRCINTASSLTWASMLPTWKRAVESTLG